MAVLRLVVVAASRSSRKRRRRRHLLDRTDIATAPAIIGLRLLRRGLQLPVC